VYRIQEAALHVSPRIFPRLVTCGKSVAFFTAVSAYSRAVTVNLVLTGVAVS
jgi:hypothetical protein